MTPKVIAYYLPQFHPTKENDSWWGKGFTEWTNVAKAKPLFKNHYQPKIPADLGFYDLRLSASREQQAEYAKMAGVSAFCYWHYWFGKGKTMLDEPIQGVISMSKPDLPFCFAWANHSWYNKSWISNNGIMSLERSKLLIEQEYPGEDDIIAHYKYLRSAFLDKRYYRVAGKLLFVIYDPFSIPDFADFKAIWNNLAIEDGLPGFHFVAHIFNSFDTVNKLIDIGYDAVNVSRHHCPFESDDNLIRKRGLKLLNAWIHTHVSVKPKIVPYSKAIQRMDSELYENPKVYPTIVPNWDHTPRSGNFGRLFQDCTPELFYDHVMSVFNRISNKSESEQVVFLKSWNEWGEGNYMEPDLKYGTGHIEKLSQALKDVEVI